MYFTSYEFLGFLAALFLLYYLIPKKFQWPLLLIASCLFYAAAGVTPLLCLLATTATVYGSACLIGRSLSHQEAFLSENKSWLSKENKKAYRQRKEKVRKAILVFCVLLNLAILAVVKYSNFFIANWNGIADAFRLEAHLSFVTIAVPLGISFYTFQAVGYLLDVSRGTVRAEKNFFRFALFLGFFPQLIQGPISRYSDLSETLYGEHPFQAASFFMGLQRALWGYFKKLVIADRLLPAVTCMIAEPETYNGAYTLVIMLFYTVELYADFTGGIDITIGIAEALGITVQENFDRPYFSCSLKEYWRRWHITMCAWFRSYVFYPVSAGKWMQKFSRFSRKHFGSKVGKRLPVYVSSFVVWFATGIWHGANWSFIVWGLCNWLVLMLSEELEPVYARFHARVSFSNTRGYQVFQILRTFSLICVLNLFDCYEKVGTILGLFASVFTADNWQILWDGSLLSLGLSGADYGVAAASSVLLIVVGILQGKQGVRARLADKPYPLRACVWSALFLSVLIFGAYGIGYDTSQFIYNRF